MKVECIVMVPCVYVVDSWKYLLFPRGDWSANRHKVWKHYCYWIFLKHSKICKVTSILHAWKTDTVQRTKLSLFYILICNMPNTRCHGYKCT